MNLLFVFENFKQEQALVGRMLMAYAEFEFEVTRLMGYALPGDTAARIIYRVKGEAARLDVADAVLRPFFEKLKIGGKWANTLGALRYCKNVRNQYAHCDWHIREDTNELCFINLDRDADSSDGVLNVQLYPTDLSLLQKQHQYFEYTADWLWHLTGTCRRAEGKDTPAAQAPKSIPQPPLHNLKERLLRVPEDERIPKGHPEGS